jgi:hypothetical protein
LLPRSEPEFERHSTETVSFSASPNETTQFDQPVSDELSTVSEYERGQVRDSRFEIRRSSDTFSPAAKNFLRIAKHNIREINRKTIPDTELFHRQLSEISTLTFPASEEGLRESFELVRHINHWVRSLHRILVWNDQPVYLVRVRNRPRPGNKVAFSVRDWFSSSELLKDNKLAGLASQPEDDFEFCGVGDGEVNRLEAGEDLREQLIHLEGYRSKDREDALYVKSLVNTLRSRAGVSYGYKGPKTKGKVEKVSLVVSHSSFALRRSFDNETLYTSKEFPKITILTKSRLST